MPTAVVQLSTNYPFKHAGQDSSLVPPLAPRGYPDLSGSIFTLTVLSNCSSRPVIGSGWLTKKPWQFPAMGTSDLRSPGLQLA